MAAKLIEYTKKHLPNIIIFLCGVIALCICIAVTERQVRNSLLKQWSAALAASSDETNAQQFEDDMTLQLQLKKNYDNVYKGDEKIGAVAFFKRDIPAESGSVFYSTTDWCSPGTTIQEFFRSVDAYSCYNAIMENDSGYYAYITVEGKRYIALYTYLHNYQLAVVQFIPSGLANDIISIFRSGAAVLFFILLLILAAEQYQSVKERRMLNGQLNEVLQTMRDKDARMDMLSYLMNEFTFEYDIEKDNLSFAEKYQTIFQRGKNFTHFRETLRSHYVVYHMDADNLLSAFDDIMNGKEEGSVLFRLQMTGGNYEWFNALYKVMYNKNHEPQYVVGKMVNVHQSQTEKEMLLTKSTRDPLTNLLNRSELEKRTTAYIENMDSEDLAALLIMDLDYFKQVNDTFGHTKGDDLLRDVAVIIRDSFRTNDIVGRLGGDEFYIFMKDIASGKDAVNKCEKLRLALDRDVTYGETTVHISSSMGITFVKEGDQFLDIYMKADSALYRAKENGRNQICTYSEEGIGHEGEDKGK